MKKERDILVDFCEKCDTFGYMEKSWPHLICDNCGAIVHHDYFKEEYETEQINQELET